MAGIDIDAATEEDLPSPSSSELSLLVLPSHCSVPTAFSHLFP